MYCPNEYSLHLDCIIPLTKQLVEKNKKFLNWRNEPESILDLAIGDGRMTRETILPILPKCIKEYIGLDISEVMLQTAKETINLETFSTIQLDATTKSLPINLINRFDHIISNYFFHYIQELE